MSSSVSNPASTRSPGAPQLFPRHVAVMILAVVACCFAGNHVAARLAFENGAGLLLAVLCRSGVALSILMAIVFFKRHSIRLPRGLGRWQLVLGLLIAIQSLCLYSAVARMPVALALLTGNTFPIILALLTWGLGGPRPTLRAAGLMLFILSGLVLALDLPAILGGAAEVTSSWWLGIGFALMAATALSMAFWITDHKLAGINGPVRSMFTMVVVFIAMIIAGIGDVLPGGMSTPIAAPGWMGLAALMVLYGIAFSVLFITVPRLDMARNASVMNMEPIATLLIGWVVLGQMISPIQMLGGLVVVSGIVILTLRKGA